MEAFFNKSFLKVSQISQENMLESLFNNIHRCFPVKFAKFSRSPIVKNICERLSLSIEVKGDICTKWPIVLGVEGKLNHFCFINSIKLQMYSPLLIETYL